MTAWWKEDEVRDNGDPFGFILLFDGLDAGPEARVALDTRADDGRLNGEYSGNVVFSRKQPNGRWCDPVCWFGRIEHSRGSTSTRCRRTAPWCAEPDSISSDLCVIAVYANCRSRTRRSALAVAGDDLGTIVGGTPIVAIRKVPLHSALTGSAASEDPVSDRPVQNDFDGFAAHVGIAEARSRLLFGYHSRRCRPRSRTLRPRCPRNDRSSSIQPPRGHAEHCRPHW